MSTDHPSRRRRSSFSIMARASSTFVKSADFPFDPPSLLRLLLRLRLRLYSLRRLLLCLLFFLCDLERRSDDLDLDRDLDRDTDASEYDE